MCDIALFILGMVSLVTGKWFFGNKSKSATIRPNDARLAGIFLLAPLPINIVLGLLGGVFAAVVGIDIESIIFKISILSINVGIIVVAIILASKFATSRYRASDE